LAPVPRRLASEQGPPALASAALLTGGFAIVTATSYVPVLFNNTVTVGPSGTVLVIAKAIFAWQGIDNVCYVNSALNGVFPTDDITAAVVYVPGLAAPLPPRTPVASVEVTNTYVGLVPGSARQCNCLSGIIATSTRTGRVSTRRASLKAAATWKRRREAQSPASRRGLHVGWRILIAVCPGVLARRRENKYRAR
jgi:hypothetical protein